MYGPPDQSRAVQLGYSFTPAQLPLPPEVLDELELLELLELLDELELLEELELLDELELLEFEPPQSPTGPPSPH